MAGAKRRRLRLLRPPAAASPLRREEEKLAMVGKTLAPPEFFFTSYVKGLRSVWPEIRLPKLKESDSKVAIGTKGCRQVYRQGIRLLRN